MLSTEQATSPTSNFQLVTDALADYAKLTGIDLSKMAFAALLEQSNSPEDILELLQEREKAFKDYRDDKRRLRSCLSPAVKVLQAFSGILGEAISLIPFSPAKAVFVSIDVLLAAASGVSSSYDALLELFECLGSFLKRLEIYITIPPTMAMTDIIVRIMVEILSVLALATKQIKQGRLKKFSKKLLGESEVEAVLQKLDRLTKDEARMTVAQTLGIVYGLVGNIKVVMEDGRVSTDCIRRDLVAHHQMLNEMNKMNRDQLRWDVQHWLSPPDPSTNHNFIRKARHIGTAAWFFESNALTQWKASGSLLWIHGKPGAGKSTLLSAVIQDIEGMHAAGLATMAYYYFDFRDDKKQDCYGFLSSLISQLSSESDSCYNILSQLYSHYTRGIRKPDIDELKRCMTDMLSLPEKSPIYVIVDAIDECPNSTGRPTAREEVLELIEELVDLKLPNVHLCVASRPEMDVRMVLEPLTSLKISLHDESGQKEDIIEYIKSVVRSDRSMRKWKEEDRQLVIDTLSDKADGMFRWVVCQVDRLCRTLPASIRKVLDDLPKTLDETYSRTLLGIDEEKREYARRLFRCLTVSIRPLRVEELAEILAVQFNKAEPPTFNPAWRPENAQESVMSVCSSLIAIVHRGGYQVVQFSHFSVKEFLTSERLATAEERLSYYHILPEPAHIILAHASLSVLLQLDDKIDRNTIYHFPLAPYAARHWVDHAQFGNVSLHIQEVMEHLFDPAKPHFAAWIWLYDIDCDWIEPMSMINPTRPKAMPLYYAALSGFRSLVEHLITTHSRNIDSQGSSHTTPFHAALWGLLLGLYGHVIRLFVSRFNNRVGSRTTPVHPALCGFNGHAGHLHSPDIDINSRGGSHATPLHAATVKGHVEVTSLLLKSGADPNSRDNQGRVPLHRVTHGGHLVTEQSSLEITRLLVNSGAEVNVSDDRGWTPLHAAARNGCCAIVQLLLVSGASLDARDQDQQSLLHLSCGSGKLEVSRFLIVCGSDVKSRDNDGCTPLHTASRYGHINIARLLLDCGSDVNARETRGWTPLHYASRNGYLGLARLLIDRGADMNAHGVDCWTPIHFASSRGHLDVAKLLVERGANIDSRADGEETRFTDIAPFLIESGAAMSARDDKSWTLLHKGSNRGDRRTTKLLEGGINIDIRKRSKETPLYLASSRGKLDVTRFLIEHGADIYAEDNKGWNPLHIASQNGHLDVVQILINSGVAVDIRNGAQMTPLALASSKGKVEVGRFLVERGADINMRDNQGFAPIHFASRYGHFDMARLLLDHGVDANIQRDDVWSPLHLASANGYLNIAELLLQRGARVDVFDEKLKTPLYQAVRNGKVAIACLLINHGANPHSAAGSSWSLLHAASQRGHLGVVKLLLGRGVDVNVLNKANKTAAESASENGQTGVAKFIAEYKANVNIRNKIRSTTLDTARYAADEDGKDEEEGSLHDVAEEGNIDIVKSFLERGVDINCRNSRNQTPLYRAARKGNIDIVRLLIERGAEVGSRDKWGWTPLHFASRSGHLEVSRVLVDHGANVNARQRHRWTPIHLSAENGHCEVVKLLLQRGADVHALNDEGETPYQLSLQTGNREITELLWEHGAGRASPRRQLGSAQGSLFPAAFGL